MCIRDSDYILKICLRKVTCFSESLVRQCIVPSANTMMTYRGGGTVLVIDTLRVVMHVTCAFARYVD